MHAVSPKMNQKTNLAWKSRQNRICLRLSTSLSPPRNGKDPRDACGRWLVWSIRSRYYGCPLGNINRKNKKDLIIHLHPKSTMWRTLLQWKTLAQTARQKKLVRKSSTDRRMGNSYPVWYHGMNNKVASRFRITNWNKWLTGNMLRNPEMAGRLEYPGFFSIAYEKTIVISHAIFWAESTLSMGRK